ncbi:hypothetical protein Pd630_LPD04119 [Rhodococcus opacus PD630]|nr:hypothetical protein Pd630_LPD04119 [Rhodococcus opacus PD630]
MFSTTRDQHYVYTRPASTDCQGGRTEACATAGIAVILPDLER